MGRKLNPNPQEFINEAEKFSKSALNRKAEMIAIYEAAVDSNQIDVYRELCFTAKYLLGLLRVIRDGKSNPQISSIESVKKDFSANMINAVDMIRKILAESNQSQKKYFDEEFFEKSHSALSNLNELLMDLEKMKLYLNFLKRSKS